MDAFFRTSLVFILLLSAAAACSDDDGSDDVVATPEEQREQYEMCLAEGEPYEPFEASISTAGRVAGFESIADELWRAGEPPDGAAFDEALDVYLVPEGLQSRVARREDERQPPVVVDGEEVKCGDLTGDDLEPARCVGPAQIAPKLNDAFEAGGEGTEPQVNAAIIEASLLWFLYISSYKEAVTCTEKRRDCDSSWAYYNGAKAPGEGIGLSGYVRAADPSLDEEVGRAHTAVRCWRSIDAGTIARNEELRADALDRLEASLDDAFAAVIKARAEQARAAMAIGPGADWTFVEITGRALLFAYDERLPDQADAFEAALDEGAPTSAEGWEAIVNALDAFIAAPAPQL